MEKELVEYIAKNLVNDPSQVQVHVKRSGSATYLELKVASEDMGRVIGRQGRVANAIRALLQVIAAREDMRIVLDID